MKGFLRFPDRIPLAPLNSSDNVLHHASASAIGHPYIENAAMASADSPAGRTLCEVNCQLVFTDGPNFGRLASHACPDIHLSCSDHAPGLLTGSLPTVLAKVSPGQLPRGRLQKGRRKKEGVLRYVLKQLLSPLPGIRSRLQAATGLQLLPGTAAQPVAWHLRKPLLAAADSAGRIHIYDFAGKIPALGQPPTGSGPPPPLAPSQLVHHEFQRGVAALAWRPNSGASLAAACLRGVCLWHLGGRGPLGGASGRAEGLGSSSAGSYRIGNSGGSNGSSSGGAWMTWLRPPASAGPLSCLAWHPRGHLLAAASQQGAGFFVWDVATGACTPVRAGTEPVSLLSWSHCGSYLLAAHPSGSFRVWQTQSWWALKWSAAEKFSAGRGHPAAGGLAGACWSPDSRTLVVAYAAAPQQLVSLHFTADPPSLQAQLLPLSLPEIATGGSRANGGGSSSSRRGGLWLESMAWDPRGQRLAVALGGSHPAAGRVALYDTRCEPLLSARFIGFMRVEPMAGPAAPTRPRASAGSEEIEAEGGEEGADGQQGVGAAEAGPGDGATQLSFWAGFGQGALLAVRRGDFVGTVPLYFSS